MPKTMKPLGSSENRITNDNNVENVVQLGVNDVVLVYCNLPNNAYKHGSRFLYASIPNKPYGRLIDISSSTSKNHKFAR